MGQFGLCLISNGSTKKVLRFSEILRRQKSGIVVVLMLVFLSWVLIAFCIGIIIGWVWKPNWVSFGNCIFDGLEVKNQTIGSNPRQKSVQVETNLGFASRSVDSNKMVENLVKSTSMGKPSCRTISSTQERAGLIIEKKKRVWHHIMAQLPEGITELLQHEKLRVPMIKCHNVIVLTATNVDELNEEWDAMIDLRSTNLLASTGPFVSKHLTTSRSNIEVAQPLSKIPLEFPDVHTGCYRKSRSGPLTITLEGKDQDTVEAAMEALSKKLSSCVKQISG